MHKKILFAFCVISLNLSASMRAPSLPRIIHILLLKNINWEKHKIYFTLAFKRAAPKEIKQALQKTIDVVKNPDVNLKQIAKCITMLEWFTEAGLSVKDSDCAKTPLLYHIVKYLSVNVPINKCVALLNTFIPVLKKIGFNINAVGTDGKTALDLAAPGLLGCVIDDTTIYDCLIRHDALNAGQEKPYNYGLH